MNGGAENKLYVCFVFAECTKASEPILRASSCDDQKRLLLHKNALFARLARYTAAIFSITLNLLDIDRTRTRIAHPYRRS